MAARMTNNMGEGITDAEGKPADPFQFGSGHFEPTKAADPGLVYDASYEDYLLYLCNINVTSLAPKFKCPKVAPKTTDLNYPSLSISKIRGPVTVRRTVTNVSSGKSLYFASVKPPMGFSVVVQPSILKFNKIGEKKRFTITVKPHKDAKSMVGDNGYGFGWYTWTDGVHMVRSPMAVSLA
ncbi:Subtilisin-like protease, fibronectin type-III domain [Dillenia turbinata]|uniref:Subtilisin-like protease, fibronectin type-III domain n=1 Tax=Dillenia turbinata TaxID=194707 RepID=A0AAN8ZC00_9MAGN